MENLLCFFTRVSSCRSRLATLHNRRIPISVRCSLEGFTERTRVTGHYVAVLFWYFLRSVPPFTESGVRAHAG